MMTRKKLEGVIIVLKDDQGNFLLGKRSLSKKLAPGYWVPISGTIEPDENEEQAVVRECLEEIGVKVESVRKICEMPIPDETFSVLHWWLGEIVEGAPVLKTEELTEIRWVSKEKLQDLDPVFEEHVKLLQKL